jgi:hypothetical protein
MAQSRTAELDRRGLHAQENGDHWSSDAMNCDDADRLPSKRSPRCA